MCLSRLDCKRRGISQDLGALPSELQCQLWKPQIITDPKPDLANRGGDRRHDSLACYSALTFHQPRAIGDINVKEMDLAIRLDNGSLVIDEHMRVVKSIW